jgi:glycosyltransferase involved in cell wall biosynthesis
MRTGLLEEGFRDEQIALVPTGIETDVYAEAFSQGEARASAEIKARTVLCVAKYRYEKGLDILLHAWTMVQKRVPEARLLLIGGGQLEAQLRAMIEDLGLTESVDLAGQSHDVPALLGQVDVFVLPSRYEGMSNALLEAMAAGLPCVATEVSGNEDNIVPDESGLLVPPGNPEALAEALITVLTQPAKARELGRAARNRALYHYDRKILMPQLIDLYSKCIAAASSARKSRVAKVQAQQTSLKYRLEPVADEEAANR